MSYAANTAAPDPDVVGITIGTNSLKGWQDVRITRGIERCASDFAISLTEKYPTEPSQIVIQPGAPCRVTIGSDTIITGYVDKYVVNVGPQEHTVVISGRSKVQDLLDCSAKFGTYTSNLTTIVGLANKMASPFGITVSAPDGDSAVIPTFSVTLTETPYEILESVARWAQFLIYDDVNGNLVIATVGDSNMASGFVMPAPGSPDTGGNVQSASVSFDMNTRYTEIDPIYVSNDFLIDPPPNIGSSSPVIPYIPGAGATDVSFPMRADGQPRYRPLLVVSPQTQNSPQLAAQYAQWEMARRWGRSQQVRLVCDSWRDGSGKLWQPNAKAPLNLPSLKLINQTWLISEVTYHRGEDGTTAEVVLMPPSAFVPQKEILVPYDRQIEAPGGAQAPGALPK